MTFIRVKVTLESISLCISYLTVNILLYFGLAEYMEMKLIMPKKKKQTPKPIHIMCDMQKLSWL